MANARRSPTRARQPWRERPLPANPEMKGIHRWLLTAAFLALAAVLVWLVWPTRHGSTFAYLYVENQDRLLDELPPVPFLHNDFEAFRQARPETQVFPNRQTHDSMIKLGDVLRAPKTLVLYVAAHGVSLDGVGYLLCSDFSPPRQNCLEISRFLDIVRGCGDGDKLVLLDAGHVNAAPRLGMLVNEFPELLAEAVARTQDEKLWVLAASGSHEASQVSQHDQRGLFSYYVVKGLAGDADVNPADAFVDLAELAGFVGAGLKSRELSQSQSPRLLWGGSGRDGQPRLTSAEWEERLRRVSLLHVEPLAPTPTEEETAQPLPSAGAPVAAIGLGPMLWAAAAAQPSPPTTEPPTPQSTVAPPPATGDRVTGDSVTSASATDVQATDPTAPAPAAADKPGQAASEPPAGEKPEGKPGNNSTDKSESQQSGGASPEAARPGPAQPGGKGAPAKASDEGENDPWADLAAAWQLRDAAIERGAKAVWTPLDYAPHVWCRYETLLLAHEVRRRGGLEREGGFKLPSDLQEELDQAQRGFLQSAACKDLDEPRNRPFRAALQLRNDCFHDAVNLVAWQARRAGGADAQEISGELREFLTQLAALDVRLARQRLDAQDEALLDGLRRLRARLRAPFDGPLDELVAARPSAALARQIDERLSTPLLGAAQRVRLLKKLGDTRLPLDAAQAAQLCAQPNQLARLLQSFVEPPADPTDAWQRGRRQAGVEAQLVALVDAEQGARLQGLAAEGEVRQAVRAAGRELAAFYRALPDAVAQAARSDQVEALRLADRGLRLLAAYDAGQPGRSNPIPRLAWTAPIVFGFEFAGFASPSLTLDAAQRVEGVVLSGQLRALDDFANRVQLELDYDAELLEVTPAAAELPSRDARRRETFIDASRPLDIAYRVRPLQPGRAAAATVVLRATHPGYEPATQSIEVVVPPPQDIDLVVVRSGAAPVTPSRQQLALKTFPGHVTPFQFHARHYAGSRRTISVALYGALSHSQFEALREQRASGRFVPGELTLLATAESVGKGADGKPQPLKQIELPADDSPQPIPWASALPAPAPPSATTPGAAEASEPEAPQLVGGLLCCAIQDAGESQPRITWIDVAPWTPKDYLAVSAGFASRRLRIAAAERPQTALPADHPVGLVWTDAPASVTLRNRAEIVQGRAELFTQPLNLDARDRVAVHLDVDGYPRAFVLDVPAGAPANSVEPKRDLCRLAVRLLPTLAAGGSDGASIFAGGGGSPDAQIRFELRADVPDLWFQPGDARDSIEAGIDENDDGQLDPSEVRWTAQTPRQATLRLGQIQADGLVSIAASVTDWLGSFENRWRDLDFTGRLLAQIKHNGRIEAEATAPLIIDSSPPLVRRAVPQSPAYSGAAVQLVVMADDGASGVQSVSVARDTNRNDRLDLQEREGVQPVTERNEATGAFAVPWEVPKTAPVGTEYRLLVWATDQVGLDSVAVVVPLSVEARPEPVAPAPGVPVARKGTFQGVVLYAGDPVSKATVTMKGPVNGQAETDRQGKFTFTELTPGDYEFDVKGIAINRYRAGTMKKTVPSPPPKQPIDVSIPVD